MTERRAPYGLLKEIDRFFCGRASDDGQALENVEAWVGIGFRLGDRFFVAPMAEVQEVLREPDYTLLPGVKEWMLGVANMRGHLLPVVDLNGFLGQKQSSLRKQQRVMVVRYQGVFVGLRVDAVFGMQRFSRETYLEHTPDVEKSIAPFLQGAFDTDRAWLVFYPFRLVSSGAFLDIRK